MVCRYGSDILKGKIKNMEAPYCCGRELNYEGSIYSETNIMEVPEFSRPGPKPTPYLYRRLVSACSAKVHNWRSQRMSTITFTVSPRSSLA